MHKKRILKKIISEENNRIVFSNILGSFVIKGAALIVTIITLPAYIEYFDNNYVLGLWFTILSVLTWILAFDLGIGNGLRNYLVHAIATNNDLLAKKYISSAYIIIGTAVVLLIPLSATLFRFINWNFIFNVSTDIVSKQTLYITVCIVFSGILLHFLFKLITSILYAMQKSAVINLLNLLTSLIILVYVSVVKSVDVSTNLISLAIVYLLAVNVPLITASVIIFSTKLKKSRPNLSDFENKYAMDILKLGGIFLWIQIMYMFISTTNEYLISLLSGPEYVVEYQVYNRLFTLIGMLFTLGLAPIWSAVTKAIAEHNYNWVKNLYKTLRFLSLFAIIIQFAMIPFLQNIIDLWLGNNVIKVNYYYSFIFALSGSVFIWNGVLASFANGFGELRIQSIFLSIGAILKLPLAWFLILYLDSWIGAVIASIIAMSLYCIVQPIWLNRFLEKNI